MPCKHVREFFLVFPSKYLEKSDFLPIRCKRINKGYSYGKKKPYKERST